MRGPCGVRRGRGAPARGAGPVVQLDQALLARPAGRGARQARQWAAEFTARRNATRPAAEVATVETSKRYYRRISRALDEGRTRRAATPPPLDPADGHGACLSQTPRTTPAHRATTNAMPSMKVGPPTSVRSRGHGLNASPGLSPELTGGSDDRHALAL